MTTNNFELGTVCRKRSGKIGDVFSMYTLSLSLSTVEARVYDGKYVEIDDLRRKW